MRRERKDCTEMDQIEALAQQLEERADELGFDKACTEEDLPVSIFLPTGLSVLNCSISGRTDGGWPGGRVSQIIGPPDIGKSLLFDTALAEATINPKFDGYRLIDFDVEHARTTSSLFGPRYAERVEHWYRGNDKYPVPTTVEELHFTLLGLFDAGQPFVAKLDSLDFLPSIQELEESDNNWEKWRQNKDLGGSYNMSKQKYLKKMFREVSGRIGQSQSFLFLVSQIIANVSGFGASETVAGGNAVEYAVRYRGWLKYSGTNETIRDQLIGRYVTLRNSKNHINFRKRNIGFWVYEDLGLDDIRSTVDFLIQCGHWTKERSGYVNATDFGKKFYTKDLVKYIDRENLEGKLDRILQRAWNKREEEINESCKAGRKNKYL